jgi:4-hydroxy-2-oxoglutarate aldolase
VAPVHLRDNARTILSAGATGIVAGGSTGEASLLSDDEFRQVVSWLRDVVPEDRWLIAGAGRESTRASIAACRAAADEGADAVLVRTPSYYAPVLTPQAVLDHFRRIGDESPVPVILYHFPRYTNVPITEATVHELAKHQNVWGIKDSSGDLKNFAAYRAAAPEWSLYIGSGGLFYAALELGAAGAIAAAGNFAARPLTQIHFAFGGGDRQAAGSAQEVVAPLHRAIVQELGVPGIKAAMDYVGLAGGAPRSPIPPLGTRDRERVAALLAEAKLAA